MTKIIVMSAVAHDVVMCDPLWLVLEMNSVVSKKKKKNNNKK